MVKIRILPQFGQVMIEGDLLCVMGWLDTHRWAKTTINVYCWEDTGEIRANAVCGCIHINNN